jgi:nucleoid-associated protein YgaU
VVADAEGNWSFETEKTVPFGQHAFRAETYEETAGGLVGRAMVGIKRLPPAPQVAQTCEAPLTEVPKAEAAAPPSATPAPTPAPSAAAPSAAAPSAAPSPKVATVKPSKTPPPRKRVVHRKKKRPTVYSIRRGDTLWDLATEYLGGGWRYENIYRANRKVIREPDLIYPKQKVKIPRR